MKEIDIIRSKLQNAFEKCIKNEKKAAKLCDIMKINFGIDDSPEMSLKYKDLTPNQDGYITLDELMILAEQFLSKENIFESHDSNETIPQNINDIDLSSNTNDEQYERRRGTISNFRTSHKTEPKPLNPLEKKINELTKKNEEVYSENIQLRSYNTKLHSDYEKLREKNLELEDSIYILKESLKVHQANKNDQELEDFKEQFEIIQQKLNNSANLNIEKDQSISRLLKELETMKKRNVEIETSNSSLNSSIRDLQIDNQKLLDKITEMDKIMNMQKQAIKQHVIDQEFFNNTISDYKDIIEQNNQFKIESTSLIDNLKNENENLKSCIGIDKLSFTTIANNVFPQTVTRLSQDEVHPSNNLLDEMDGSSFNNSLHQKISSLEVENNRLIEYNKILLIIVLENCPETLKIQN